MYNLHRCAFRHQGQRSGRENRFREWIRSLRTIADQASISLIEATSTSSLRKCPFLIPQHRRHARERNAWVASLGAQVSLYPIGNTLRQVLEKCLPKKPRMDKIFRFRPVILYPFESVCWREIRSSSNKQTGFVPLSNHQTTSDKTPLMT